ncbi:carbohydrate kinase family protein [Candidatus Saccharibacteria bacterium]|nr:carbohydrate kinase family protein [Candidatus Saccharibacteria bacterium]
MSRILTIGKATQDVFLSGQVFAAHREKGIFYQHLQLGSKLELGNVIFSTGGNATNAATTFARQGLDASYMWVLGTEIASQAIMQTLDAENVDLSAVVQDDGYRASYSSVLLAPDGERTILNYHGTMVPVSGFPLDLERIGRNDWLYVSSLGTMGLLENVVTRAHKAGVKVAMNPAGSELAHPKSLIPILHDVSILSVNKEEAQLLVEGKTAEELARRLTAICPTVIVSDGPRGSVATDGKQIVLAGMYQDVPVIDRTGAGDAFASGFVTKVIQGASLEEAVVFASANSTSVVQKIGAKDGILHRGTHLHDMPLTVKAF